MNDRYKVISEISSIHSVIMLCQTLGVSHSGYYDWRNSDLRKRRQEDIKLKQLLVEAHEASPCYGVDNLHAEIRERMPCSRRRVRRLMNELGIKSQRQTTYKATTNSSHSHAVAPNLLKGFGPATAPDQVWHCDISYIPTDEGWLYLAIVKDRFTREVVGWHCSISLASDIALHALEKAIAVRKPAPGLIAHSDRGVQYCCNAYRELLEKHGIVCSMSRKGNPYDNAMAENFFSCLKCELVYRTRFSTRYEAESAMFEYIEVYYNRRRRHSALGRIAPATFAKRFAQSLKIASNCGTAKGLAKGKTEALANGNERGFDDVSDKEVVPARGSVGAATRAQTARGDKVSVALVTV